MLSSPLENGAERKWRIGYIWKQKKPRITQRFGKDFRWIDGQLAYARFGLKGHNGIDFGAKVGTPVYAPCQGQVRIGDQGNYGYGLHIKLREKLYGREVVLAHLSKVIVENMKHVPEGELLGFTGNTGYSSGPHLHFGLRFLVKAEGDIWEWFVKDHDNGYKGYVDLLPKERVVVKCFKGGFDHYTINPL